MFSKDEAVLVEKIVAVIRAGAHKAFMDSGRNSAQRDEASFILATLCDSLSEAAAEVLNRA